MKKKMCTNPTRPCQEKSCTND